MQSWRKVLCKNKALEVIQGFAVGAEADLSRLYGGSEKFIPATNAEIYKIANVIIVGVTIRSIVIFKIDGLDDSFNQLKNWAFEIFFRVIMVNLHVLAVKFTKFSGRR